MSASKSADALARDHATEAIGVLHDIMVDPLAENKDRLRAAETLLERGHGKAVSAVISVPLDRRQKTQLAAMSDEELMAAIRDTPLPRLAAPVSHRTFSCGRPGCPGDHECELELCAEVEWRCTCHPDDNPPRPCPKKYAFRECCEAAGIDPDVDPLLR